MVDNFFNFFGGEEGGLDANGGGGAGGEKEGVAFAHEFFGASLVQNSAGVDLGHDGERDAGGDVGFDGAGDDIDGRALGGDDEVNANGAGKLGEATNEGVDFFARSHHEVGKLVDDDDDVGEAGIKMFGVEFFDVANFVFLENAEATSHFGNCPFQSVDNFVGIGNNRSEEVGDFVVHGELDSFGVDEDEFQIVGGVLIKEGDEEGVDGN